MGGRQNISMKSSNSPRARGHTRARRDTHLHSPGNSVRIGTATTREKAAGRTGGTGMDRSTGRAVLVLAIEEGERAEERTGEERGRERERERRGRREGGSRVSQVLIVTKQGKTLCADPNDNWTKKAMEKVDKEKQPRPATRTKEKLKKRKKPNKEIPKMQGRQQISNLELYRNQVKKQKRGNFFFFFLIISPQKQNDMRFHGSIEQ
uniref:Chemokine interleukin-8-like domain-containing protein n=1 Tax=Salarias fasciatus TaxID=181472 RepID=A0A672IRY2_SALFA